MPILTKTQIKIMQIFTSQIVEKFSIKQIAEILKKPYPLIHRSIKDLINKSLIIKDNQAFLSLNYKQNIQTLAFVEDIRKEEFIKKDKTISLLLNDIIKNIDNDFFILIIFGSSIYKQNPHDLDILLIIKDKDKLNQTEKQINNVSSNFSIKTDINVISVESAYEMLIKRDKINILNETLNKHIIVFGAENYYQILKNAI